MILDPNPRAETNLSQLAFDKPIPKRQAPKVVDINNATSTNNDY